METYQEAMDRALSTLKAAGRELRQMCRGLRPASLDDLGLAPATTQLVEEFRARTGILVDFDTDLDEEGGPLDPAVSICAYRVLQEALTNVSRHARARSVEVGLRCDEAGLSLTVYDDGDGFDPPSLLDAEGLGLAGMRERADLVDGTLEIRSSPGQGTRLHLTIPTFTRRTEEEEP